MSLIDDLEAAIARYPQPPSKPMNIYGCIMVVAAHWARRAGLNRKQWLQSVGDAWDKLERMDRGGN